MSSNWSTLRELIERRGINGKVIVSAELGISHNGDPDLAKRMIEASAGVGCQAVKVQNYRTGDMVKSRKEIITVDGKDWNAWDLFSRCELDLETVKMLKEHAEKCGLVFHSTPTNEQGVRDLLDMGCQIVKVASDMVPNRNFCNYVYGHTRNVIASTGCTAAFADDKWLWLHCVREYPAKDPDLFGIDRIRCLGANMVGYSSHTTGINSEVSAVRDHGAIWVECHVTLDHSMPGPDHRWSKDFSQMRELVRCLQR